MQRRGGIGCRLQSAATVREQEAGMAMQAPEGAQLRQGGFRQWHQTVLVTLGVADVNAPTLGVDVADLQAQSFAEAKSEAVKGEEQDAVAAHPCSGQELANLLDGHDIRQALRLRCFDQIEIDPGLFQDMDVEELQSVEIEFGRRPMMSLQQVGEIVEQLRFGEAVEPIVEIGADAANGAGVGLDCFRAQTLELQMFEMTVVLGLETGVGWCCHGRVTS